MRNIIWLTQGMWKGPRRKGNYLTLIKLGMSISLSWKEKTNHNKIQGVLSEESGIITAVWTPIKISTIRPLISHLEGRLNDRQEEMLIPLTPMLKVWRIYSMWKAISERNSWMEKGKNLKFNSSKLEIKQAIWMTSNNKDSTTHYLIRTKVTLIIKVKRTIHQY